MTTKAREASRKPGPTMEIKQEHYEGNGCIHVQVRFMGELGNMGVFQCVACGFEYAETWVGRT